MSTEYQTDLVHELVTICNDEGFRDINAGVLILVKQYLASFDKTQLINTFIKHSYGPKDPNNKEIYWDQIYEKNEIFFIENAANVFGDLPVDSKNISAFKMLFTAERDGEQVIIQEDRDAIWDMFYSLVRICIKYIHRKRECKLVEIDGKYKRRYQRNFFPRIKVLKEAKKWGVELEMPEIPS